MDNSAMIRPDNKKRENAPLESLGIQQHEEVGTKAVVWRYERGNVRASLVTPHIWRLEVTTLQETWAPSTIAVEASVTDAQWSKVVPKTAETTLVGFLDDISVYRDGRISCDRLGGLTIVLRSDGSVEMRVTRTAEDHFYGLGEETGFLDKRHDRYEMWNSDVYSPHVPETSSLYESMPFVIRMTPQGEASGLFIDNPGRVVFDMRSSRTEFIITALTSGLDAYFLAGPTIRDVVAQYTFLTGHMAMPPKWALGYHQSRFSYQDESEVRELAKTFRDKEIGCDAIHLDIHYMQEYRVFTFDAERFPNPGQLVSDLAQEGFHVVPIVDPGVKQDEHYEIFQMGMQNDYFCRHANGQVFIGDVWPGASAFPDFSRSDVADWWGQTHRFYTDMGISGIWNDMNEPAVFNDIKTMPSDVMHDNDGDPVPHGKVHNLFGLWMAKATFEGLTKLLRGKRPFVLTRAGFSGIQKYAAVWTGDNRSFWEHLAMAMPMVMNLGLSGVAFAGTDIGGFAYDATGDLLVRWTQMGTFFPFMRNHSALDTTRQEPWQFGPEVEAICRKYINLRYAILPYLYSLFYEATQTGAPVMRPLVWEYPLDPKTHNLSDQFLVGSSLLVAPIYRPDTDRRLVYLPAGVWYDYWTGERYSGNRYIVALAPLDVLPLFVKAGAVIVRQDVVAHTGIVPDVLHFDLYPHGDVGAEYWNFYEDDGETTDYQKGRYNLFTVKWSRTQSDRHILEITPRVTGYDGGATVWELHLRHAVATVAHATPVSLTPEDWRARKLGWMRDESGIHVRIVSPRQKITLMF